MYKKYLKYKNKYLQLKIDDEFIRKWSIYKILGNIMPENDYDNIKCKIFSSFDNIKSSQGIDLNSEFILLNAIQKKLVMKIFFGEIKSIIYNYHICENNSVIFYNSERLNVFINAFELHKIFLSKEYLLNLPCVWTHNRPETEKILISLLFGSAEPCLFNVYGNSEYLSLDSEIWQKEKNYKEAYETFIRMSVLDK